MPDSSRPSLSASTVAARSSSEEAAGCRASTSSWSAMSLRAHWMMPMPMNSSAPARDRPMVRLEAPQFPIVSGLSPMSKTKYDTSSRIVQTADSPNRVATWRSARFSAFGSTSVGRHWCSGSPGLA